jgi:DNA-binding transcriptional MerR regulator/effector-binding domain-containing protein
VFTIGPFARLAGVSPKVLRTYDALGLFRPVWVDPATDYRFYSPAQLPELRRIVALRDMGVGLAEIGSLVSGGADLGAVLDRRRSELEAERREIDRRLATLDIRVEMRAAGADQLDVVVRPVAAAGVATLAMADREDDDVGAAFYELEASIRDLGRRAHRPPGALIGSDGAVVIFVPVNGPVAPTDRMGFTSLPACRVATAIVRGPYRLVREARGALERWVEAAGMRRVDELRIVYLQFGAEPELRLPRGYVVENDEDLVTELQLPVA